MMQEVQLREVASARAGDKGNTSNVSVWAYDRRHYEDIKKALTPQSIKSAFPDLLCGPVEVYPLDHLHGVNVVMHDALEGGVNASLNIDLHGRNLSFLILSLPVQVRLYNDPGDDARTTAGMNPRSVTGVP